MLPLPGGERNNEVAHVPGMGCGMLGAFRTSLLVRGSEPQASA